MCIFTDDNNRIQKWLITGCARFSTTWNLSGKIEYISDYLLFVQNYAENMSEIHKRPLGLYRYMKVNGTNLWMLVFYSRLKLLNLGFCFVINDGMFNSTEAEFWLQLDWCNSSNFSGTAGFDARAFQTCLSWLKKLLPLNQKIYLEKLVISNIYSEECVRFL